MCWSSFKPRFDEFEIVRLIGTGNFSEVFHAVYTGPSPKLDAARYAQVADSVGQSFALKCVEKAKVKKLRKEAEVVMEKDCLRKLNDSCHSAALGWENIIKLKWTFQDSLSLYIVTEYCPDGELWALTTGVGIMDESLLKCYAAQLVNALEYMHSRGIVHRDLKAENIVVNQKNGGTLKLIDFGTAVDLERPELESAGNIAPGAAATRAPFRNFVGSANFMAPEVVRNKASGTKSDLWSFGCTLFQIASGKAPFEAPSDFLTHLASQNRILDFPPHFPPALEDLVLKLLETDPSARLSIQQIKAHYFFSGIDFHQPVRHIQPPLKPFPSLLNLCFSHMSRNWDRFSEKWEAAGWANEDPEESKESAEEEIVHSKTLVLSEGENESWNDRRCRGGMVWTADDRWLQPAKVATLEVESRRIMQEFLPNEVRPLRERLLWWKKMDRLRLQDESFWDSLVQQFMKSGK